MSTEKQPGLPLPSDTAELHSQTVKRRELENFLRLSLQQAEERYEAATRYYRNLLREHSGGARDDSDNQLLRARQAESDALADYRYMLELFTNWTLHGEMPKGRSARISGGVRE